MATSQDIEIFQGATFTMGISVADSEDAPIDVSGWTFRGKLRRTTDASAVLASFSFASGATTADRIASLSATVTAALSLDTQESARRSPTLAAWDIEAEKTDGTVYRLGYGVATIWPEATYG